MAWNEPGGNNRDPWGGGGRDPGPPDLDEVVRKLSDQLRGLFGQRRGGMGDGGEGGGDAPRRPPRLLLGLLAGGALVLWAGVGSFYIVDEGKRGVVQRFGRYAETTQPGLRWHLPYPIESVQIVDIEQIRSEEIGYRAGGRQPAARSVPKEALMLTQDENIIDLRLAVQYQVADPRAFLFRVVEPDVTLRQAVESATREVVGRSSMDFVLTEGRSDIVAQIRQLAQAVLDQYQTGLRINSVNLQDAQPPEDVQEAFADAIKAREDEQRQKNEAEAYANEVLPRARGQAARRLQEAEAYRAQVVSQAEGEAARFAQILEQYQKAPDITRQRLYLDTMQTVLGESAKVLVDVSGNNNLMVLPLDKLLAPGARSEGPAETGGAASGTDIPNASGVGSGPAGDPGRARDIGRTREVR